MYMRPLSPVMIFVLVINDVSLWSFGASKYDDMMSRRYTVEIIEMEILIAHIGIECICGVRKFYCHFVYALSCH